MHEHNTNDSLMWPYHETKMLGTILSLASVQMKYVSVFAVKDFVVSLSLRCLFVVPFVAPPLSRRCVFVTPLRYPPPSYMNRVRRLYQNY